MYRGRTVDDARVTGHSKHERVTPVGYANAVDAKRSEFVDQVLKRLRGPVVIAVDDALDRANAREADEELLPDERRALAAEFAESLRPLAS